MITRIDFSRPWHYWPRSAQAAALLLLLVVTATGLWLQSRWQSSSLSALREQVRGAQAVSSQAAPVPAAGATGNALPDPPNGQRAMDPSSWPVSTQALDDWVREAAQGAARANGVVLQQLSVTRPDPLPASGPGVRGAEYVSLSITARGTYSGLKQWQSELQELLPTLGLESMAWQAPPNDGSGQLSAQWTWRLWTRSEGEPSRANEQEEPVLPAWRPELLAATRDPFALPVKVLPAPVVQVPKTPVPVVAPVVPAAPPLQWTTLGRLQGPDGRNRVTGHWGTQSADIVTLAEGDTSPAGHKVVRITATKMELQHPDTQATLGFSLPPLPRFERR